MARRVSNRLTDMQARKLVKAQKPLRVPDGDGLYLEIHRNGSPSWVFRFAVPKLDHNGQRVGGRERWAGVGAYPAVSLTKAREVAGEMRRLLRGGIDPIEHRKRQRVEQQAAALQDVAGAVTFRKCAESYVAAHRAGWRNDKHAGQWSATLEAYAFPILGGVPMRDVDVAMILKVLRPIWTSKPETAVRVRQRIEAVIDSAAAEGLRTGSNPARWKGHLDKLLPRKSKVATVKHHPAMPHASLPAFYSDLSAREAMSARALAFTVVTAARSGEVRGAVCSEFDLDAATWTIPAERMKAQRQHRVPLPDAAVAILRAGWPEDAAPDALVFPGLRGNPMSENTMRKYLIEDLNQPGLTVHGFRSTFRDWVAEATAFPRELAEAALAHVVGGVEGAYQRGDLFDRRRKLMDAWARYCMSGGRSGQVVQMGRRNKA